MVFGGSKLDRDDRNLQPIAQADGAAGQLAEPPYRAGTIAVQPQIMQRNLPRTRHVLVWGEARVRPKPGVPPQAPASSHQPERTHSAKPYSTSSSLLPPAAAPKPSSYIEALQSDPKPKATVGYSSSYSSSYGLKKETTAVTSTSSTSKGYGLESDVKKSSTSLSTSPYSKSGGYGLESDVKKSSVSLTPQSKSYGLDEDINDDYDIEYDLPDLDSSATTKKAPPAHNAPASSSLASRYGRVSTPDGPSTPRSSSPSGTPLGTRLTTATGSGGLYGSVSGGYKATGSSSGSLAGSRPGSGGGYGLDSDLKKTSVTSTSSAVVSKPSGGYGLDSDLKSTSGVGKSSFY